MRSRWLLVLGGLLGLFFIPVLGASQEPPTEPKKTADKVCQIRLSPIEADLVGGGQAVMFGVGGTVLCPSLPIPPQKIEIELYDQEIKLNLEDYNITDLLPIRQGQFSFRHRFAGSTFIPPGTGYSLHVLIPLEQRNPQITLELQENLGLDRTHLKCQKGECPEAEADFTVGTEDQINDFRKSQLDWMDDQLKTLDELYKDLLGHYLDTNPRMTDQLKPSMSREEQEVLQNKKVKECQATQVNSWCLQLDPAKPPFLLKEEADWDRWNAQWEQKINALTDAVDVRQFQFIPPFPALLSKIKDLATLSAGQVKCYKGLLLGLTQQELSQRCSEALGGAGEHVNPTRLKEVFYLGHDAAVMLIQQERDPKISQELFTATREFYEWSVELIEDYAHLNNLYLKQIASEPSGEEPQGASALGHQDTRAQEHKAQELPIPNSRLPIAVQLEKAWKAWQEKWVVGSKVKQKEGKEATIPSLAAQMKQWQNIYSGECHNAATFKTTYKDAFCGMQGIDDSGLPSEQGVIPTVMAEYDKTKGYLEELIKQAKEARSEQKKKRFPAADSKGERAQNHEKSSSSPTGSKQGTGASANAPLATATPEKKKPKVPCDLMTLQTDVDTQMVEVYRALKREPELRALQRKRRRLADYQCEKSREVIYAEIDGVMKNLKSLEDMKNPLNCMDPKHTCSDSRYTDLLSAEYSPYLYDYFRRSKFQAIFKSRLQSVRSFIIDVLKGAARPEDVPLVMDFLKQSREEVETSQKVLADFDKKREEDPVRKHCLEMPKKLANEETYNTIKGRGDESDAADFKQHYPIPDQSDMDFWTKNKTFCTGLDDRGTILSKAVNVAKFTRGFLTSSLQSYGCLALEPLKDILLARPASTDTSDGPSKEMQEQDPALSNSSAVEKAAAIQGLGKLLPLKNWDWILQYIDYGRKNKGEFGGQTIREAVFYALQNNLPTPLKANLKMQEFMRAYSEKLKDPDQPGLARELGPQLGMDIYRALSLSKLDNNTFQVLLENKVYKPRTELKEGILKAWKDDILPAMEKQLTPQELEPCQK